MENKYYVIPWYYKGFKEVIGPFKFNEALSASKKLSVPFIIVKLVVDENGKEVL